jgi:hypothetical protein
VPSLRLGDRARDFEQDSSDADRKVTDRFEVANLARARADFR